MALYTLPHFKPSKAEWHETLTLLNESRCNDVCLAEAHKGGIVRYEYRIVACPMSLLLICYEKLSFNSCTAVVLHEWSWSNYNKDYSPRWAWNLSFTFSMTYSWISTTIMNKFNLIVLNNYRSGCKSYKSCGTFNYFLARSLNSRYAWLASLSIPPEVCSGKAPSLWYPSVIFLIRIMLLLSEPCLPCPSLFPGLVSDPVHL